MGGEHAETHLLPSPQSHDAARVQIGSDEGVKFDALGPLVVNSDGVCTDRPSSSSYGPPTSMHTDFVPYRQLPTMTEPERERTMRVLVARNKSVSYASVRPRVSNHTTRRIRIADQEKKQEAGTESTP